MGWALAPVLGREDDLAKMKMRLQVPGPGLGVSLVLGMCEGCLGTESLLLTVPCKTNPAPQTGTAVVCAPNGLTPK